MLSAKWWGQVDWEIAVPLLCWVGMCWGAAQVTRIEALDSLAFSLAYLLPGFKCSLSQRLR